MVNKYAPRPNPYVGPRAFRTGETLYGRDTELRQLMDLLVAERIVLLHSPSGAGKTSLIRAGLIPGLISQGFTVLPVIRLNQSLSDRAGPAAEAQEPPAQSDTSPSPVPPKKQVANPYVLSALLSLEEDEGSPNPNPLDPAALQKLSLIEYLNSRPARLTGEARETFAYREGQAGDEVLIFDQFEEILTTSPADVDGKAVFFNQVGEALRERSRWALFAMREDYTAALAPYIRPVPTRLKNTFRLDLLEVPAAMLAIREPVRSQGVAFNENAAMKLVNDLRTVQEQQPDGSLAPRLGPYVEPVQLQVVCYRLWEHLAPDDMEITTDDLEAVGDVDQSLAEYYAESVSDAAEQTGVPERQIRAWVQRELITEQGIRTQVMRGQESSQGMANSVIEQLRDSHLIRAENRRAVTWYELAHDRLVYPIRQNNEVWFGRHLVLLQKQAVIWEREKRPAGMLLGGRELEEAAAWAEAYPDELTQVDRDFLAACQAARQEQLVAAQAVRLEAAEKVAEAERLRAAEQTEAALKLRQRLIASVGLLLTALVFAIAAGWFWSVARTRAAENLALADTNATNAALAQAASTQAILNAAISESNRQTAVAASTQAGIARATAEFLAEQQAGFAASQARQARANQLAALSNDVYLQFPQRSLLLSVEAVRVPQTFDEFPPVYSLQNMYDVLSNVGGLLVTGAKDEIWSVAVSRDNRWLAASGRGAEIYLWDRQNPQPGGQPIILEGHTGSVSVVQFFPGKPWLASLGRDGTLRFWTLPQDATGPDYTFTDPLIFAAHTEEGDLMQVSPDGSWLATGGRDNRVVIFDVRGSQPAQFSILEHGQDIAALAFSPDGRFFASGSADDNARVWQTADWQSTPTILPHPANVISLAFNPSGSRLATGTDARQVFLWDLNSANLPESGSELTGHTNEIRALAFSPDGRWLASGSLDRNVILWDLGLEGSVNVAASRGLFLRGHLAGISSLVFSQKSTELYSSSIDGTFIRWNLTQSDPGARPVILRGHEGAVRNLVFLDSGNLLVTASTDKNLRIWDTRAPSSYASPFLLSGHTDDVRTLDISPEGRWLATGGKEKKNVRVWDLNSEDPQSSVVVQSTHTDDLERVRFSPDGRWLATAGGDRLVLLYDAEAAQFETPFATLEGHEHRVLDLTFTPDSQNLISGGRDGKIWIWALEGALGAENAVVLDQGPGVEVLSIHPDGCRLAAGDDEGGVLLWNVCNPAAPPASIWQDEASGAITAVAFNTAGDRLAAATASGLVLLWGVSPGSLDDPLRLEGHREDITALAFSRDGRWLATASNDNTTYLYDFTAEDGMDDPTVLQSAVPRAALTLGFTPDSTWLATGSEDNNIRLWDLTSETPGAASINLLGGQVVYTLGFDPDGNTLISGSRDGLVRLWHLDPAALTDLACSIVGRNMTREEWDFYFPTELYRRTCKQWP